MRRAAERARESEKMVATSARQRGFMSHPGWNLIFGNVATLWTLYPSNTRSRVTLHAWGLSPPPPPERRKSKVAAVATLRLRAPASERGERWVGGRGREVEGGSAEALAKMYNMMMIVASDVATNQSCQELRSRAGRG